METNPHASKPMPHAQSEIEQAPKKEQESAIELVQQTEWEAFASQFLAQYCSSLGERASHNVSEVAVAAESGLDRQAKQVLEFVHSFPPSHQFAPHIVRAHRQNPYEHESVDNVETSELTIDCGTHSLPARLYVPQNPAGNETAESRLPALVYFHGGGFVLGDLDGYDQMLAQLCSQSGVIIISVAYRLAPETPFPGAVFDAQLATDWVFRHGLDYGIDTRRIAIGGDSAGANLATVYCLLNKHKRNHKRKHKNHGTPCLQLLIYPSLIGNGNTLSRESFSDGLLLTRELIRWFHGHYISKSEEDDPRFNVLKNNDFSGLPPAFILTCGFDPLRDEGQMYADALKDHGVVVQHSCYTDMFHGFINFGVLQQAQHAVTECAAVLTMLKEQLIPLKANAQSEFIAVSTQEKQEQKQDPV